MVVLKVLASLIGMWLSGSLLLGGRYQMSIIRGKEEQYIQILMRSSEGRLGKRWNDSVGVAIRETERLERFGRSILMLE